MIKINRTTIKIKKPNYLINLFLAIFLLFGCNAFENQYVDTKFVYKEQYDRNNDYFKSKELDKLYSFNSKDYLLPDTLGLDAGSYYIQPIGIKDDSESAHILDTFNVLSHKIILQSEVFLNHLNIYERVFEILMINKLDYVIVEIQNRIGVSAYELFIRERNNKLEIFKQTGWDRISYKFEIAKDDYDNTNANLICLSQEIKPINGIIRIPDDLDLANENTKDCFACPQQYTTEECLQKKQSGEKFNWKE